MSKAALKFLVSVAVVVGIIAGVLRAFFVLPVTITDDGMAPTLLAGETVLMWRSTATPEFGDLLVCRHPSANNYVVGRFIARPGMTIGAERGNMQIDGQTPDRNQGRTLAFTPHGAERPVNVILGVEFIGGDDHAFMQDARFGYRSRDIRVREGIFLLGDNRLPHEFDSRTFGPVDPTSCIGHIFLRWKAAPNRVEFENAALDMID
ncbi:MAG: signal peptidase I [Polyangiales bacterium]|nr:signal peptidase I [Myxococcales bacterium]MCB9659488.1 signal peptidase I [Sandaracinaceae bacterium]